MRHERKENFSEQNFIPENYQQILESYNVKIEMPVQMMISQK